MPTITEQDAEELYTKEEAAEFLHVSMRTIDRMIRRREVDFLRVGSGAGRVRFTKRALLDYLNRSQVTTSKTKAKAETKQVTS